MEIVVTMENVSSAGGATLLSQLQDVNIDSPSVGQALVFDGEDWVNQDIEGGGGSVTVIDNLASTSPSAALSANQGRVLKGQIDGKQNQLAFTPVATTDPRLSDARTPLAHQHAITDVTGLTDQLAAKATPAYVDQKITELIGGAPAALDTLKEIADELSDSGDAVAALTSQVSQKEDSANKSASLSSPDNAKFPTTLAVSTALDGKANSSHTHTIAQVTGLETALDAKANSTSLATVATTGQFGDLLGKPRYEVLSALPGDLSGYPDGSRIVITG